MGVETENTFEGDMEEAQQQSGSTDHSSLQEQYVAGSGVAHGLASPGEEEGRSRLGSGSTASRSERTIMSSLPTLMSGFRRTAEVSSHHSQRSQGVVRE